MNPRFSAFLAATRRASATRATLARERFAAFTSADFRRLWAGQVISAAGSQMQFAALNWQIYALTGSPLALGGIGLARVIPIIIFSLLGGALADSRDRRTLLIITQSVLTCVALTLGLLALTGHTTLASIYILTAIGAAATAFDNPARQALIPSLVPREQLPNAFALNSTGFQVATIAGPVLAGLLIGVDKTPVGKTYLPGVSGLALAYFANALSFLAVIVALLRLQFRPEPRPEGEAPAPAVSIDALKEGIAFVRGTPILVGAMTLDFFATFFSSATALLPIFAADILKVGPVGYGWLSAFPAVGSLVAGSLMTLLPPIQRQGRVLLWSVVVYGFATIGFGLSYTFGPSLAFLVSALFLAATGASDTVSTVLRQTIRQTVTPDRLRGRMVSINMIFFMGGPQLGELEAGALAKFTGAAMSVVWGGVGCIATAAIVAARAPWLYRYRLTPDPDP